MADSEKKMWFAPKTYGYGAGLPISWEGWALLLGFVIAAMALGMVSRLHFSGGERVAVHIVGTALLLVPFILIVRSRTEGGWRWRNGDE